MPHVKAVLLADDMRQHLFALVEDTGVICAWKSYAMRRPCCASCPRSWRMARSLRDRRSVEISAAEGMTCPAMLYTYCCNRPLRGERHKTPVPRVCLAPHGPRGGGPWPDWRPLVLVAAPCCPLL